MADNLVYYTQGTTGGTVATDDLSGIHYQRVKPVFGGDGTATDVTASTQLPVIASGTVTTSPTGTQNVFTTNSATVVPSGTQSVFLTNSSTVVPSGTQNVFLTNSSTIVPSGTQNVFLTNSSTVVPSGTQNIHATNQATVTGGSVVIGQGWTLGTDFGSTAINLTATGTVIAAVASKRIYVYSEAFTVQGGTVTVTVQQGAAGGTISGPRQFSPTGGIARANSIEAPLYYAAAGSPVVFTLSGSGTVGGDIAWVANA